ncbi:IS110 family transposase [Lentzea sp. BCCO 10_0856]|uniref:IS110 family transposase n=1 Tax=Lentzea miocenica TaxID=3095431 RepID=A0ABU4SXG1_9PSEU|nr:IS110 family transposase [Lentzea sp. BCCO 10_0856]MDX8030599.1 IS110 family transposase [Lentzea sp. BCCO 10_0856]
MFGGVDTHTDTHHAAALDHLGRLLGDAEFPATPDGCAQLPGWLTGFGPIATVGVEGTGSYGKQLAISLRQHGIQVREVSRPDRRTRRSHGKSDVIDAINAARAVISDDKTATPKTADGPIESIRALRIVRGGAVKARTAARNELTNLITTAPAALREALRGKQPKALLTACTALEPDLTQLASPTHGTMLALRSMAERIAALNQQITQLDKHLDRLVTATAPTLVGLLGIGTDVAGQLLVTAGDNPQRLHSEAAFAKLCGVAPLPASSGRTDRHRLNKGGERQANRVLHIVAVVRLRYCPRTKAYLQRRTEQGLTKRDILRCLKRYILREAHTAIMKDLAQHA